MNQHSVRQGTQEWLNLRQQFHTASEAASMLGVSTYMTRDQLIKQKATGIIPEVDVFTQKRFDHGHDVEAKAREVAEGIVGEELYPVTVSNVFDGIKLLASMDGLTMFGNIGWEHKLLNKNLEESLQDKVIPEQYRPQLEQQLLVSGAESILFMASDGAERMFSATYESDPELRKRILDGWKQFEVDVKAYQPERENEVIEATRIESLPSLSISISGGVKSSNLAIYKETAIAFIDSINTDLQNDQDFADAEETVKFCKKAENEIAVAKKAALSQTADIDTLFKMVDDLAEQLRQKRLKLEKLVKSRKEAIKSDIITDAKTELEGFIINLESGLGGYRIPNQVIDWNGAIKSLRTLDSLKNAINTTLAQAKIDITTKAETMMSNIAIIEKAGKPLLFPDAQALIQQDPEYLAAVVQNRISQAEAQEKERIKAAEEAAIAAERAAQLKAAEEAAAAEQRQKEIDKAIAQKVTAETEEIVEEARQQYREEIAVMDAMNKAIESLIGHGIGKNTAKKVVNLIAADDVDHLILAPYLSGVPA